MEALNHIRLICLKTEAALPNLANVTFRIRPAGNIEGIEDLQYTQADVDLHRLAAPVGHQQTVFLFSHN